MAAPIRPLPPSQTAVAASAQVRTRSPEAVAAQRAFFAQALGQAGASSPSAPAVRPKAVAEVSSPIAPAPAKAAAPAQAPTGGDASPTRILRPGSLIDIKV